MNLANKATAELVEIFSKMNEIEVLTNLGDALTAHIRYHTKETQKLLTHVCIGVAFRLNGVNSKETLESMLAQDMTQKLDRLDSHIDTQIQP